MKIGAWSARSRATICAAALALALAGCKGRSSRADAVVQDTAPFAEAVGPSTYVPKVKTILTGLPATAAEVQAVTANPAALRSLIDQWMATPQFEARMVEFFRNAFQQNNVSLSEISSSLDIPDFYLPWSQRRRLEYLAMDSFPLTALQLVKEGRPFNETVTTRRFMMSTALMAALSYADLFDVNDQGDRVDRLYELGSKDLVLDPLAVHSDGTPVTTADSVAWFHPGKGGEWVWRIPVENLTPECEALLRAQRGTPAAPGPDPDYGRERPRSWNTSQALFGHVFGGLDFDPTDNTTCGDPGNHGSNQVVPLLKDDLTTNDWEDWRMVTVETIPISDGDAFPSPAFWDLPALRASTTLRLKSPHLGFLGTLAWYGNWSTNESNQARVTANQALIVALGLSIIPAAAVAPAPLNDSDSAHSTDPACAACHKVLDPLRQFFRQSYTYSYHEQRDLTEYLGNAAFLLGGMNVTGRGIEDLANILATHPHFALGWAQKLQFWANTNAADEADPELQRVAHAFESSHLDFRVLVRELFSSPLVTLAGGTATYRSQGVTVGIARRDQLCAALSARLGIADACEGREYPWRDDRRWGVADAGQMLATDTYYRAAELPSLPRNPDLFFRRSVELVCSRLAQRVVQQDGSAKYSSATTATVNAAIADFVATIMALPPGDPRADTASEILKAHYADALAVDRWALGALRSAFVLACTSPSSVLMGL
jgi:hypothetical protein